MRILVTKEITEETAVIFNVVIDQSLLGGPAPEVGAIFFFGRRPTYSKALKTQEKTDRW